MDGKTLAKKIIGAYAIACGAGLVMACSFAGLDSWEEKRADKRKVESDLEYTKDKLDKTNERLEDSDRLVRACRMDLTKLSAENARLQRELDRLKAETKAPEGFRT